jgi:hypothetical protein
MFVSNKASTDGFWLYWNNYSFYLTLGLILSLRWSADRKILNSSNNQSLDCHADKSARNDGQNMDIATDNHTNKQTSQQSSLVFEILQNFAFIWLFLLAVAFILKSDYNPFIYFNF